MTNPLEIAKGIKQAVTEANKIDKPVTVSFVGGEKSDEAMRWLVENGIPAYGAPDLAVSAMASLREYAQMKAIAIEETAPCAVDARDKAMEIINAARATGAIR